METTEATPTISTPPVRPTFLTVLCILTFIWSGGHAIRSASHYFTADSIAAIVKERMEKATERVQNAEDKTNSGTPAFVKSILGSVETMDNPARIREFSIFAFIAYLLTLSGAIMMWMLKKPGFYLYIAGTVVLVITPFVVMGGALAGIEAGFGALTGLIFIIMYGANLRYMA